MTTVATKPQLCFEDVAVDSEIKPLVKGPITNVQLVLWAGASGNMHRIHYDRDFALRDRLPDVIMHGPLKEACTVQMLVDWIGDGGHLLKMSVRHRGMHIPGDTLHYGGKVTKTYVKNNMRLVECEIWMVNQRGDPGISGTATVVLPLRGGPPLPLHIEP